MDLFLVGSRDTLQVVVVNVCCHCDFIKLATVCALISRRVIHIPIIPIEQWKNAGGLGYIGDYTTQSYGDYI